MIRGIDLFAGAGGMSVGASMAGIRTIAAVEKDYRAAETYAINHPDTEVIVADIRNFRPEQNKYRSGNSPLIVFGGPPCQGFSTSNQRTRTSSNPSNWLWEEFLRIVETLRPDAVVLENVRGILETERGIFVDLMVSGLESLQYESTFGVLDASDFGVPQRRSRFFLLACIEGKSFTLPASQSNSLAVTVEEAIDDLPVLENGASVCVLPYPKAPCSHYAAQMRGKQKASTNNLVTRNSAHIIDRYRYVPQGGNWKDIPEHLMDNYEDRRRCHTGIYRRLRADEPARVIGNFRKNMLIHPFQDRGLSVREAARLQSFPDSYRFSGSIGFQQQQVGNAVPPLLAAAVFRSIVSLLS